MELGQRQRAYARRASQQEDLAELRSRHEQFRSSMFSSSGSFAPTLRHGTGSSEGRGGGQMSMDSDKPTDRIEAAILAGMAVDAERGANTFNRMALTPAHSGSSSSYQGGVDPGSRPGTGRVSNGGGGGGGGGGGVGGGNGALFGQNFMPTPPGAMHGGAGGAGGGGGVRNGYYTGGGGDSGGGGGTGYYGDGSGGVYNTYHPQSGGAGGVVGAGGGGDSGYPMRAVPADGSGASGSLVRSEGSHGAASGSRGGGSAGGGSGSSIGDVFRYSGEDPAHQHPPPHRHPSHQHPHPQRGDSGGSGGQSGSSAGGGSTERRRRPPSGPGYGREAGRGMPPMHQGSGSSGPSDEGQPEIAGQDAFGPPESDEDVTPRKAVSGDSSLNPGEGGGVSLTPKGGGEDSLELPDGCHHISLSKFLEVMTGPGLRVRKHHRAGKGSSGLRVLRYAPDDDSLTWDSHKILGAAQHVLPMADVTGVSMQSGNRVVLTCVGGRDSYAVFEAANNDAGAVLYVGLERLRKRTVS